jgi:Chaperone of endosialidase
MNNQKTIFTTILLVLGCVAFSPVAQARQLGEDRGNGNSAAERVEALNLGTTGSNNTAHGWFSLFSNTTGLSNTADGFQALYSNTTGSANTAIGASALLSNTTGFGNTAIGGLPLFSNTEGDDNTALGNGALFSNTTGSENTAVGFQALVANTTRDSNTAVGSQALLTNTTGTNNTAVGAHALFNNVNGANNTALGIAALATATGSGNVGLGDSAGGFVTTANHVICIGSFGQNVSDSCFIGNIAFQPSEGVPVLIDATDKLGTPISSGRFKDDIRPMAEASEALFTFKPVTFRYKKEIDPKGKSQFGLVAEDVEKVNPDLVVRDKEGKPYSVRYDQVNAMLLNEFLKEHRKVEKLNDHFQTTVARQQKEIEVLTAQLKEQAAQIQKVSAQIQISRPALKTVLDNQ